ncbi:bifunctional diguanylate cyclase/phosphodiesterase [Kineosporia sp. A_224]|uniref:putative bifunctional diguanylate cyclase/phosphodiesterase n=1 Tax=Kineosporia sp. A_224 TaxID=1962180 RepID=UPI00117A4B27|nr:EAL domain-containing protein [Kineosporia sp. A_224]
MIAVGLVAALERLRPVVDLVPAAFVAVDADEHVTVWNPAAEQLFGWRAADVLGAPDPTLGPRGQACTDLLGTPHEVTRRRSDGEEVDLTVVSQALHDAQGLPAGRLSVYAGGAERRRLELQLAVRAKQQVAVVRLGEAALGAASMADVSAEAVRTVATTTGLPATVLLRATASGRGRVSALLTAAVAAPGWAGPVPWGVGDPALAGAATARQALATRQAVVTVLDDGPGPGGGRPAGDDDPLRAQGVRALAAVVVGPPSDPWGVLLAAAGAPDRFDRDDLWFLQAVAGIVAAADARRTAEAEVRHRALHDALTGLPNREMLLEQTARVLAEGRSTRHTSALLLVDLDGFKDVNDSHGHQAGDRVLVQVADRVRVAIGARGLVARLGGDEFAVLVGGLETALDARGVAEDLLAALDTPCATPGGTARIGGSVGIALAPTQGDDPTTLLMRADLAMYRAKRERLGYTLFDARRDHDASGRLALVTELRAALEDGTVGVEYQPFVALQTHTVQGAEALVRWSSPRRGPQAPADFVRLAEQAGLIEELTTYVLRTAARQAAVWRDAGADLAVSVNVSPVALATPGLDALVLDCIERHGLGPDRLRLEVTESSLANDAAVAAIERLARRRVRIAIDDFGTGYSSLSRLKRLPVSTVKVDRSFVTELADDPRDAAMLRAIMTLARDLGLRVVAEGVETVRAARAVTELGVHQGQGLLYAPAMSVEAFDAWADRWARGGWPCCAPDDAAAPGTGPAPRVVDLRNAAPDVSPARRE